MATKNKPLSFWEKTKIRLAESRIKTLGRIVFNLADKYPMQVRKQVFRFDITKKRSRYWYSCLTDGIHEKDTTLAFIDSIEEEDRFIDIGSHVGFFSVIARRFTDEVYAVEMNPTIIEDITNQDPSIQVICAALSADAEGIISFGSLGGPERSSIKMESEISVATTKVEELIKKTGKPDIVKMDVEGAEKEILPSLLENSPPDKLILELHHSKMSDSQTEKIVNRLNSRYKVVMEIVRDGNSYSLENIGKIEENISILCRK